MRYNRQISQNIKIVKSIELGIFNLSMVIGDHRDLFLGQSKSYFILIKTYLGNRLVDLVLG